MGPRHLVVSVTSLGLLCAGLVVVPAQEASGGPMPAVSSTTDGLQPDARRRPRLRVVPPGPASPTSPVIDSYYYLLQHRKCADLRVRAAAGSNPEDALFSALADLCLAARSTSYRADWTAAQQALDVSADLDDCLSLAARKSLTNAVVNHDRTRRQRPDFRPTPTGSTCVPRQTFVGLLAGESGASLIVLGLRLFEATDVKVDDTWIEATSRNAVEGTECARVDVPGWEPPQPGETMTVRVRGRGYTTTAITATIGVTLTEADLESLDTTACLPAA